LAQATGQGAFPLSIHSNQLMSFDMAGIEIEFNEKEDGQYKAFQFSQSGMKIEFSLKEQ